MPQKTGLLELRRVSQLGYGDLVVNTDMSSVYGETQGTGSQRTATVSWGLSRGKCTQYADSSQFHVAWLASRYREGN